MSDKPEFETRITALRDGGFVVWRGDTEGGVYNPPAKAVTTLGEALHYVASVMGPNAGGSGQNLADANSKSPITEGTAA